MPFNPAHCTHQVASIHCRHTQEDAFSKTQGRNRVEKEGVLIHKVCCSYKAYVVVYQRESEEAAKVYEEFVASFEDPHSYKDGTQTFVKSSTMIPRGIWISSFAMHEAEKCIISL